MSAAQSLALQLADGRLPRLQTLLRTDRLESFGEAQQIIAFARAQAAKKSRGLAHPQLCLDAIAAGIAHGGRVGLQQVRCCA